MITPRVFGAEHVISNRQRVEEAKWIDKIVEDARSVMIVKIEEKKLNSYKVQWSFFDQNFKRYRTWEEIPEGLGFIIQLRVEEIIL